MELRTDAYYEEDESLSYTDTSRHLTDLKKEKTWLREVSSVAKVPGSLNVRWSRGLPDEAKPTSVTLTKGGSVFREYHLHDA